MSGGNLLKVSKVYSEKWGSTKDEDIEENIHIFEYTVNNSELCLIALTRGIDISKGPEHIKKEYLKQLPSVEWQMLSD